MSFIFNVNSIVYAHSQCNAVKTTHFTQIFGKPDTPLALGCPLRLNLYLNFISNILSTYKFNFFFTSSIITHTLVSFGYASVACILNKVKPGRDIIIITTFTLNCIRYPALPLVHNGGFHGTPPEKTTFPPEFFNYLYTIYMYIH